MKQTQIKFYQSRVIFANAKYKCSSSVVNIFKLLQNSAMLILLTKRKIIYKIWHILYIYEEINISQFNITFIVM